MKKSILFAAMAVVLLLSPARAYAASGNFDDGSYDPTTSEHYNPDQLYVHYDEVRHSSNPDAFVVNNASCNTSYFPISTSNLVFFKDLETDFFYCHRYNGTGFTKLSGGSSLYWIRFHTWWDGIDRGVSEAGYNGWGTPNFLHGEFYSTNLSANMTGSNFQTNVPVFTTESQALAYFRYGDTSGMLNRPTSSNITTTDDAFFLKDFKADATISATWSGVSDSTYVDDAAFVDVFFGYGLSDKPGIKATLFEWGTRYKPDDNGFSIPRHEIVLPESKVPIFLRCMFVTPVYMRDGKYVKGLASRVWFTREGLIESIETISWGGSGDDSGTTPTPPPEDDTSKGILDTIRNFFSTFFTNIATSIKGLFIPEDGYFEDFFSRMNEFFSEKLGMLYAPIDIFVTLLSDIMTAGVGNSGIQFPGVMWDGTYIIQPQVVSLSTIAGDFPGLQDGLYFVTDVIMVGAVLSLAQQKLKEVVQT